MAATTGAPSGDSMRSRGGSPGADMTTVRDKYRDCQVKSSTTSFALYSNGKIYMIDDPGNQTIAQQMSSGGLKATDESGAPRFMMVTIVGSPSGDRLPVTSIQQRQRRR